jgi:hypothetical protein
MTWEERFMLAWEELLVMQARYADAMNELMKRERPDITIWSGDACEFYRRRIDRDSKRLRRRAKKNG